jgi:hypothetical protein
MRGSVSPAGSVMSAADRVADLGLALAMPTLARLAHSRLLRAAQSPQKAQSRTLRNILDRCRETEFGREHAFAAIKEANEFRRAVPICDYEALRPAIDRQIATGRTALAPERPIFWARTSGTTGQPKLIPVTKKVLHDLKRAQRAMAYVQHRAGAFGGRILAIGGAYREETMPDGSAAGAISGLVYRTMPHCVRAKYVLPPELFALENHELKYALFARLAVRNPDITVLAAANPSTFQRLHAEIRRSLPVIAEEVAEGCSPLLQTAIPAATEALREKFGPDPARARILQELVRGRAPVTFADLWPSLRAVVTWLGAGCAPAAGAVADLVPPGTKMIDFGYVASEMRATVVVDAERNLALPLLDDCFFEFVPLRAWDDGIRATLLLHELDVGELYQIIVTTHGGLPRYWMNDVVQAGPRIGQTPTLRFVRKGRGVTNITGEKISEDQIVTSMARIARRAKLSVNFFIFLADAERRVYRAYVESADAIADDRALAAEIDRELCSLNIEYACKRASGRLHPLQVVPLAEGTGESFRRHCVNKGQRESQLKIPVLQSAEECRFDLQSSRQCVPHG